VRLGTDTPDDRSVRLAAGDSTDWTGASPNATPTARDSGRVDWSRPSPSTPMRDSGRADKFGDDFSLKVSTAALGSASPHRPTGSPPSRPGGGPRPQPRTGTTPSALASVNGSSLAMSGSSPLALQSLAGNPRPVAKASDRLAHSANKMEERSRQHVLQAEIGVRASSSERAEAKQDFRHSPEDKEPKALAATQPTSQSASPQKEHVERPEAKGLLGGIGRGRSAPGARDGAAREAEQGEGGFLSSFASVVSDIAFTPSLMKDAGDGRNRNRATSVPPGALPMVGPISQTVLTATGRLTSTEVALHAFRNEIVASVHSELQSSTTSLQKFVRDVLGKTLLEIDKRLDFSHVSRSLSDANAWMMTLSDDFATLRQQVDYAPVFKVLQTIVSELQDLKERVDVGSLSAALSEIHQDTQAVGMAIDAIDFNPIYECIQDNKTVVDLSDVLDDLQRVGNKVDSTSTVVVEEVRKVKREIDFSEVMDDIERLKTIDLPKLSSDVHQYMREDVSVVRTELERLSDEVKEQMLSLRTADLPKMSQTIHQDITVARREIEQFKDDVTEEFDRLKTTDIPKMTQVLQQELTLLSKSFQQDITLSRTDKEQTRNLEKSLDDNFSMVMDELQRLKSSTDLTPVLQKLGRIKDEIDFEPVIHAVLSKKCDHGDVLAKLQEVKALAGRATENQPDMEPVLRSVRDLEPMLRAMRPAQTEVDLEPILVEIRRLRSARPDFSEVLRAIKESRYEIDFSEVLKAVRDIKSSNEGAVDRVLEAIREIKLEETNAAEEVNAMLERMGRSPQGTPRLASAQVISPQEDAVSNLGRQSTRMLEEIGRIRETVAATCRSESSMVLDEISKLKAAFSAPDRARGAELAQIAAGITQLKESENSSRTLEEIGRLRETILATSRSDSSAFLGEVSKFRSDSSAILGEVSKLKDAVAAQKDSNAILGEIAKLKDSVAAPRALSQSDSNMILDEIAKLKDAVATPRRGSIPAVDFAVVLDEIRETKAAGERGANRVLEAIKEIRLEEVNAAEEVNAMLERMGRSPSQAHSPPMEAARIAGPELVEATPRVLEEIGRIRDAVLASSRADSTMILEEVAKLKDAVLSKASENDLAQLLQEITKLRDVISTSFQKSVAVDLSPILDAVHNIRVKVDNSEALREELPPGSLLVGIANRRGGSQVSGESDEREPKTDVQGLAALEGTVGRDEQGRSRAPMPTAVVRGGGLDARGLGAAEIIEELARLRAEVGLLAQLDFAPVVGAIRHHIAGDVMEAVRPLFADQTAALRGDLGLLRSEVQGLRNLDLRSLNLGGTGSLSESA